MRVQNFLFCLSASCIVHCAAFSQSPLPPLAAVGNSPLAVYDKGEVDEVNPVNGNLYLHIPILEYPQLGHSLKLNFKLFYNDKAWFISNYQGQHLDTSVGVEQQPSGQWAFVACGCMPQPGLMGVTVARDQHLLFGADDAQSSYVGNATMGDGRAAAYNVSTDIFSLYVQTPDGSKHYYGDSTSSRCSSSGGGICPSFPNIPSESYPANDSSGYVPLPINCPNSCNTLFPGETNVMLGPDGLKYTLDPATHYESITDTTGNTIGQTPSGWMDSVGRNIPGTYTQPNGQNPMSPGGISEPIPGVPSDSPSSCPTGTSQTYQWNVPAYGGSTQTYYLCYQMLSYHTNFNLNSLFPPIPVSQSNPTGFSYANIAEASGQSLMLTAVVLPNNTSYTFSYDQYLSLATLTLPTGGSISYTWQIVPFSMGENQDLGNPIFRALRTRTVNPGNGMPASTWYYAWYASQTSVESSSPASWSVVTDPNGKDTERHLGGPDDQNNPVPNTSATSVSYYDGCSPHDTSNPCSGSGSLLRGDSYVMSSFGGPITGAPITNQVWQSLFEPTITTTKLPAANGNVLQSQTIKSFAPGYGTCVLYSYPQASSYSSGSIPYPVYSQPTTPCSSTNQESTVAIYDYGMNQPGPLLRTTSTTYQWQSTPSYLAANLIDLPSVIAITSPTGAKAAETDYSYDQSPSPTGTLGNLTSTTRSNPQGVSPTMQTRYNAQGMPVLTIDANGNQKYVASWQCSGLFPQQVIVPYQSTTTVQESTVSIYDCSSGLPTAYTDPNGITTGYSYDDPLERPTRVRHAIGTPTESWTTIAYPTMTEIDVAQDEVNKGDGLLRSVKLFDGLGRSVQEISPAGAIVDTTYDGLGSTASVSNPHYGSTSLTDGVTSYTYDALGRVLYQFQPGSSYNAIHPSPRADFIGFGPPNGPGGTYLKWTYLGNQILSQDEAGNVTTKTEDALGRLSSVVEAGGQQTSYSYDALGNLKTVVQAGVAGDIARVRTFTYDALSRLVISSNPETGTVCYGQWNAGSCINGYDPNGNVLWETDARGSVTSYVYDALNRTKFEYHSDGSPTAAFGYDGNDESGNPLGSMNSIGRLDHISNDINVASTFSFDALGRMTDRWECLATDCSYGTHTSAGYDLANHISNLTYPDGRRIVQAFDSGGRLSSVSSNGSNYISGAGGASIEYFPNGAEQAFMLGNGVVQTNQYNARLQPCYSSVTAPILPANPNGGNLLDRAFLYGSAAVSPCGYVAGNNGNIFAEVDNLHVGHSQSFAYDSLNRVIYGSRSDGAYNHTYHYDSFGNMTLQDNLSPNNMDWAIDPATNQLLRNPVAGVIDSYGHPLNDLQYDLSGNMIVSGPAVAGGQALGYNTHGQIVSVNGGSTATYIYSAAGDRAYKATPSGSTDYVYFNGQAIAEKDQSGNWTDYIYANGRKIAMEKPSQAIWIHGANGSPGEGMVTIAMPSISISAGDRLNWYQSQQSSGGTVGGMNLVFENGWQLNGSCTSCAGQPAAGLDQNGVATDQWNGNFAGEYRSVDLSAYAGHTITQGQALKTPNAPYGSWDLTFSLISISHADGHVDSIYDGINAVGLGEVDDPSICCNWAGYIGAGSLTHYYVNDNLGTSQLELTAGGYPMWEGQFMPFGGELPDGHALTHYKFTGKERDAESGLDYFGARYYASSMGRFMSPDPLMVQMLDDKLYAKHLADPQTWNKYAYVGNNPLGRTDPTGLDFNLTGCGKDSSTCQNNMVGTTANGKFTATVVTSAQLQDSKSGVTGTVTESGVKITTASGTYGGQFINGTPSATLQGSGALAPFTFNITGQSAGNSVTGSWKFNGTPEQASQWMSSHGGWNYPILDTLFDPLMFHHNSQEFRFSDPQNPSGPSLHIVQPLGVTIGLGSGYNMGGQSYPSASEGPFHVDDHGTLGSHAGDVWKSLTQ